ncbi:hypothetical protein [Streptomyces alboflavus]|uniref:hypothetical protein n=1 Tax=Streptomyces alboflavus TaxID=67267 RepID=UPI001F029E17|nr:hypothetical protein [Streptomyces alboflavus]
MVNGPAPAEVSGSVAAEAGIGSSAETSGSIPSAEDVSAAEVVRAEVRRECAGKLAQAELKAEAARVGVEFPTGFIDFLDTSKLLGEDGVPSGEAIAKVIGLGRPPAESSMRVSLDVRQRQ